MILSVMWLENKNPQKESQQVCHQQHTQEFSLISVGESCFLSAQRYVENKKLLQSNEVKKYVVWTTFFFLNKVTGHY